MFAASAFFPNNPNRLCKGISAMFEKWSFLVIKGFTDSDETESFATWPTTVLRIARLIWPRCMLQILIARAASQHISSERLAPGPKQAQNIGA